jgi:hypothetical protein
MVEDKLVQTYSTKMNDICWYSNTSTDWWNRERLMDLTMNECKLKFKGLDITICLACQNLKKDFHARLEMIRKFKTEKKERKWKKVSELN